MHSLDKILEFARKDQFSAAAGIEVVEASAGYVLCKMELKPMHRNPFGNPMGGAIFTLADHAAGIAANIDAEDATVITLHGDITFLSAAKGNCLYAAARRVKVGRTTTLYSVEITDELGTQVASASMNGFCIPVDV